MKNIGIWIDKEKAHILSVTAESVDMITIKSQEDESTFQMMGRPGGATEIIKDRKVLERQKQKTKQFFNDVISNIGEEIKGLIILGPSQMIQQFAKVIKQDYKNLDKKVREVVKSQKMTDNQLKAFVKEFYMPKQ
ncbi:hypothetical protein [Winogradskyella jejuensis]|uniref:Protein required for attachment to host cells n=1 Tax=Winogradskyella jejuensis TaxID=1089305 RepID=A0A1M5UUT1_9FLAO|nr:hypothetical protein [Winogradskyella jejuensis]SHH66588.1 hypothetical protein SAMN05444148_2606 [Winogradskyella jejuensis]